MRAASTELAAPEEKTVRERERPYRPQRVSRASPYQRRQLTALYGELHDVDKAAATEGVKALFAETFDHTLDEGTYEEGSRLLAQLRAQRRAAMRARPKEEAPS
jgi:hypothetical protein